MKLRVGVVGAGGIAVESHLPVFKSLKNVELVAICDQRLGLAKEAGSKFGINNVFNDLGEMLSGQKLDVVDICTPPRTHATLSIQAMETGCNVLIEKPLAANVAEAEQMVASSKKNNVTLCVVHQNLFNPVVMKAKEMVRAGIFGDLLNVDVRTFETEDSEMVKNENHWCHKLLGGIFYEILPHPVYLVQSFLKDVAPVHVSSRKIGDAKWMKSDELRVMLEANNGLGSMVASCNSAIHGDMLEILGSKMALRADLWGRTLITFGPRTQSPMSIGMSNLSLSFQLFKVIGSTASTLVKAFRGKVSAHYAFISAFVDSIIDRTKPPTTGEDGLETVKTLEAICRQI
jgi:predicted dehydrogenase